MGKCRAINVTHDKPLRLQTKASASEKWEEPWTVLQFNIEIDFDHGNVLHANQSFCETISFLGCQFQVRSASTEEICSQPIFWIFTKLFTLLSTQCTVGTKD